jgi:hypothetical protein
MNVRIWTIIALLLLHPAAIIMADSSSSNGASQTQTKAFVIVVSRSGFNGTASRFVIEVNQGDKVRLTFVYGDWDLSQDNPHVITIDGYNVVSPKLRRTTPNSTVEFVAGQSGDFRMHCSLPCLGMENLQEGLLRVNVGSGAGLTKTSTFITHVEVHPPNVLHIVANVVDENGLPVAGVTVGFDVNTTLGLMEVGTNITSADGVADYQYALPSTLERGIEVLFRGSGHYEPSNATEAFLPIVSPSSSAIVPPYVSGQNPMIDLRLVGVEPIPAAVIVSLVILVVGSVWMVYIYAIKQIVGIRADSKRRAEGGQEMH